MLQASARPLRPRIGDARRRELVAQHAAALMIERHAREARSAHGVGAAIWREQRKQAAGTMSVARAARAA